MPSERIQRQIDRLLDDAEAAVSASDWAVAAGKAAAVLGIDPANGDAQSFLEMARSALAESTGEDGPRPRTAEAPPDTDPAPTLPASFAGGRYAVRRFLGEGGRKRVFLAHDSRLDREVAFCVIRAEGLDLTGHQRVLREAQSVARLGQHPNLVTVHDIGEDGGNPYIVQEYMAGGDVAGLITQAEDHRLPVERTLAIAKDVCRGLSFIHAGGMVHRDLKPANVFLATDGAARIGDFGLAVALDRSRITQYGLMLGTVSYMPPEQALGGESTPKADFYSLGAMLYEMVTGRPPFLGDDPTAVISQHINTPPVAPSWLTEHCPPALEEVILKLLEKDPGQRPANAAEVLAALEKVDPSQKSASHSDSNVLDRLARGVFVGREKELERLRKAFDEAFAGRGGLVMLVGEPGIGKTRTTQELETYARMRGANVLWGRAHESSGAPPYWPWKQVGDSHARFVPPAELASELDPEQVAELGRIFPTLRANAQPPTVTDPESAQFRLFDAYSAFIRAGAQRAPLLIVLDDLHWADKPTLLLLQHFARELSRLRVLVVCTYRDTELSRTHPLSEALANLNREAGFLRIPLRGLSRAEVEAYIRAAANVSPPSRVVDRIFEETEGNPFFLSEVVNLMTQEGTLSRESVSDIAVPDGVREALGRRLDRISEEANELLQVCAVAGREFTYDTLTLLDERSEDQVLRLIEEAVEARVVEEMEQPGRYRFTHALMQETLLEELSTTRRVRLHGQVGEALEKRWGPRADERAPRLAEHFVEAAMLSPRFAEKAVRYAGLAAHQAEAQTAWDDAANWYGRALTLITSAEDGLGEDEAAYLTDLGRCQRHAGDLRASFRSLMRAVTLYRAKGDTVGAARSALEAARVPMTPERLRSVIEPALAGLPDTEPRLRANLLMSLLPSGESQRDAELAAAARSLVEGEDWPEVAAALAFLELGTAVREFRFDDARHWGAVAHERALAGGDVYLASQALSIEYPVSVTQGHLSQGVSAAGLNMAFDRQHHLNELRRHSCARAGAISLARGDWTTFETARDEADGHAWFALIDGYRARMEGRPAEALGIVPPPDASIIPVFWAQYWAERANCFVLAGDEAEARGSFEQWWELFRPVDTFNFASVNAAAQAGPALVALADTATLNIVYQRLLDWRRARFAPMPCLSLDALRGDLALALGLEREAGEHFQAGLEICQREQCHVDAGRCHQGLAELAARRGDLGTCMEHLDRAGELFLAHGAKLYLDQVIAKKVDLQGLTSGDMGSSIVALNRAVQSEQPDISVHAAPDGTVTLLFSDIENSTALNEQMGDAKWMEVLRAHNAVIDAQVKAQHGHVVKTMGDGYMVAFKSATDGLRCAIAIQRAIGSALTPGPSPIAMGGGSTAAIKVRIGLHTGEVVREGDDFFGRHVNLAARVAGHAAGGEIFVSGVVRELVSGQSFAFDDLGERPMKGFEQPVRVWAVRWQT